MSDNNITPQEYFRGFPEAPASDTFRWIDTNGIEHMTTIRAWTGTALLGELEKFSAKMLDIGGKTAALPSAPAPAPKQQPQPVPQTETGVMSMQVEKIKVTPEVKDGKSRVMVELFAPNHKYADIKAFFNTAEQAAASFSGVTQLDFSTAGEYKLVAVAFYRNSEKKKQNGEPYKNLVSIEESPF